MVSVMRFEVLTPARRWYKLYHFTLFADKFCSDVIIYSPLCPPTLSNPSVEQSWKLGAQMRYGEGYSYICNRGIAQVEMYSAFL